MTLKRKKDVERKNNTAVAKYFALYAENADKAKCMITFTANKKTIKANTIIKDAFIEKVRSILTRKRYARCHFKYFVTLELGERYDNPHVHIQVFYDNILPVKEAYEYIIQKYGLESNNCDLSEAKKTEISFTYIIKNYYSSNFDEKLEEIKYTTYKNIAMYSCSQKSIPNYVIRSLYKNLSQYENWAKHNDKYAYILKLIEYGKIKIVPVTESQEGYIKIKNWAYKITI